LLKLGILEKFLRVGIKLVVWAPPFTRHIKWRDSGVSFLANGRFRKVLLGEKSTTHFLR